MFYRNLFRLFGYILMVPIGIIILLVILGYGAINYNFWPPSCNWLPPIKQAIRVCEFSKREKVKIGTPTEITLWVSIPNITPASDKIYFVLENKEPVLMEKIGELSYQIKMPAVIGQNFGYYYQRNNEKSVSVKKSYSVKMLEPINYDYVFQWSDQKNEVTLPDRVGVLMFDTWTINYNFNFFEDTRKNLDSSFARLKLLGAKEVGVFTFIEALGNSYQLDLQEIKSPYKYMRDAAITEKDMKLLAENAKRNSLDVVIHYNIQADYTKYFKLSDLAMVGQGVGGETAHNKAAMELGVKDDKTKEWVDMWFDGLTKTLVVWGKRAENNKIYGIDITPQYLSPDLGPDYAYADQKYQELILALRQVYKGKIFASTYSNFGGFKADFIPKFINEVDGLYVYSTAIKVAEDSNISEMKKAFQVQIKASEKLLKDYGKDKFWVFSIGSFDGVTSGKPSFEFNDYAQALAAGNKADWQEQADGYEAMLLALEGNKFFDGVFASGYWYDDLMDPKYADPLISMHPSMRNKPAEVVWKKWFRQ